MRAYDNVSFHFLVVSGSKFFSFADCFSKIVSLGLNIKSMLSVIVITKNEAFHIAKCLSSVQWADELLVLDSGSVDETVAVAKSFGARVIETDWPGFGLQKQRALDYSQHEWVLSLDADEYISDEVASAIRVAIQSKNTDAYVLSRQMIFAGKKMRFAAYEKKHIRLFRRHRASFSSDAVHEHVVLDPKAKKAALSAVIMHECYDDWDDAIDKMNRYSSLSATQRANQGKKTNFINACLSSSYMFFKHYILGLWFLDGWRGFSLAIYQAHGAWYRHLKQLSIQSGH